MDNYVYITRSGYSNNFKIGVSENPAKRLKQLQTGSPYILRLFHIFECQDRADAFNKEKLLHKHFDGRKTKLMWGEWFQVPPKEMAEAVEFFEREWFI